MFKLYNVGCFTVLLLLLGCQDGKQNDIGKKSAQTKINSNITNIAKRFQSINELQSQEDKKCYLQLLFHGGNPDDALKICEELLKDKPSSADLYYITLKVLVELEESAYAHNMLFRLLEEGRKNYPDDVKLLYLWGERSRRQGGTEASVAIFKHCVEMSPEFAPPYLGLAMIELYNNSVVEKEKFINYCNKVLELEDTDSKLVHEVIELIEEYLKRTEKAPSSK